MKKLLIILLIITGVLTSVYAAYVITHKHKVIAVKTIQKQNKKLERAKVVIHQSAAEKAAGVKRFKVKGIKGIDSKVTFYDLSGFMANPKNNGHSPQEVINRYN